MKLRSWLSTCSSSTCIAISGDAAATSSPPTKSLISDGSSTFSDTQTPSPSSSSSSTITSNSSIQSNLSILTLPSVPSLQKLTLSPVAAAPAKPSAAALLTSLRRCAHVVNSLAVRNNLLYAATGNEINVFELTNYTLVDTFGDNISDGSAKYVAFSDGKIFTAHQDGKIRAWKLDDKKHHKLIATLPTLNDRLRTFILPRNYVRVRRHKKKLWIQHHDAVSGLATARDNGGLVFSISWDRSIKIWQARDLHCLESVNRAHDDAINTVAIGKDGLIYTGSADKRIRAWKREGTKYGLLATLEKHKSAVNALALNLDGSVLFSGSCDRSILVWEREDSANHMAVTGALRGHGRAILCLINVQDLLLSGSGDRTVRIWRPAADGRYCCLAVLDGHRTPVRSLAAAVVEEKTADSGVGGGLKVFSGSFDGEIKVWQVEVSCVGGL